MCGRLGAKAGWEWQVRWEAGGHEGLLIARHQGRESWLGRSGYNITKARADCNKDPNCMAQLEERPAAI